MTQKPDDPPRPSKRPQQQGGSPEPRPSKRPPQQSGAHEPRPSRRPPQQGGGHAPRPSKRPPQQGGGDPTIPRAPRMPDDGRAHARDRNPQTGRAPNAPRNPNAPQQPRPHGGSRDQRSHGGQRDQRPHGGQRDQRPQETPREQRPPPPLPQHPVEKLPRVAEVAPTPPSVEAEAPRRVVLPMVTEVAAIDPLGEPDFPEYEWSDSAVLASVVQARVGDAPRAISCDASGFSLRRGEAVVLESERGIELAVVTVPPRRQLVPYRLGVRVLRRASDGDLKSETRTRLREAEAFRTAVEVLRGLKLPAKVVRVECSLTGARTVVHLASDERVELREAARALTAAFKGRVELRHTGVRDAARVIGGVGPCGLQLCCNTFLADFAPVSIRHAKDQGLALNPQRVSGVCGRLMCCLVYEDAFYRQQRALFPKQGKRVTTPRGEGRVRDLDVLARTVRVVFSDGQTETFSVDEVRSASAPQSTSAAAPVDDAEES